MKPTVLFLFVFLAIAALPCDSLAKEIPATGGSFMSTSDERIAKLAALHKQAEEYIALNRFHDALETYSNIILFEPDDDVAYSNMGHIYMILGDLGKAQNAFLNALDINPSSQTALFGLQKIRDPDSQVWAPPDVSPEPKQIHAPQIKEKTQEKLQPPADFNGVSREEKIQVALKNAGLYSGRVDGKMGPSTLTAVRKFQGSRGLETDGNVGPKTWAALKPYLEISNRKERSD